MFVVALKLMLMNQRDIWRRSKMDSDYLVVVNFTKRILCVTSLKLYREGLWLKTL